MVHSQKLVNNNKDKQLKFESLFWLRDELNNLGRFPKVRTGRPDHGCTAHFENEVGFFQEFLMKNDFLHAYY